MLINQLYTAPRLRITGATPQVPTLLHGVHTGIFKFTIKKKAKLTKVCFLNIYQHQSFHSPTLNGAGVTNLSEIRLAAVLVTRNVGIKFNKNLPTP